MDSIRLRTAHIRHWRRLIQPVFVVLWNAQDGVATWEAISHTTRDLSPDTIDQKTVSLCVPLANRLDEDGVRRMAHIARDRFHETRRERDGALLLGRLLEDLTEITVEEYSAKSEVLVLAHPDGDREIYFFGELAEICRLRGWRSKDVKKILLEAARQDNARIKVFGHDGPIVYFDDQGREIRRFASRAEQPLANRVETESLDLDELLDRLRKTPAGPNKPFQRTRRKDARR